MDQLLRSSVFGLQHSDGKWMANNDGGNAEGPIFKPNCSRESLMGDVRESQKLSRIGRQAPKSELTKECEG